MLPPDVPLDLVKQLLQFATASVFVERGLVSVPFAPDGDGSADIVGILRRATEAGIRSPVAQCPS
jgi:hypothetical protein